MIFVTITFQDIESSTVEQTLQNVIKYWPECDTPETPGQQTTPLNWWWRWDLSRIPCSTPWVRWRGNCHVSPSPPPSRADENSHLFWTAKEFLEKLDKFQSHQCLQICYLKSSNIRHSAASNFNIQYQYYPLSKYFCSQRCFIVYIEILLFVLFNTSTPLFTLTNVKTHIFLKLICRIVISGKKVGWKMFIRSKTLNRSKTFCVLILSNQYWYLRSNTLNRSKTFMRSNTSTQNRYDLTTKLSLEKF